HEIKTGDGTRTLVGMVYTGPGTPGTFLDTAANRWVASWFNRRERDLYVAPTAAGTPSGSPTEVSSANRAYFLAWNDATAKANLVGLHNSNAAGST
ncbi:hypothetical protein, partial [Methylobacterium sp. E-066]|uniref:hypothetical protein n=1 Tax=Methylobacterium sp. E-066 TaxID=2836584 RepID=UPI001FB96C81